MKTAEEWQPEIGHLPLLSDRIGHAERETVKWIKQIQLDAMKEGMRRAAEICRTHTGNACNVGFASQWDCEQAILTAAEQLTLT